MRRFSAAENRDEDWEQMNSVQNTSLEDKTGVQWPLFSESKRKSRITVMDKNTMQTQANLIVLRAAKVIFILWMEILFLTFTSFAQIVGGTGTQYIQAVVPEGQLISFGYQAAGQTMVCGIHVKELAYEFRDFVFVHDLKLVGNKMECAYGPKDKPVSVNTTFSDVDFSSGHIRMTIATVPLSEPNKKYELTLTSPFQGKMVLFRQAQTPAQKKK